MQSSQSLKTAEGDISSKNVIGKEAAAMAMSDLELEWSFYMNSLDLSLAAPKIRKIQISRFLRSVLE